MCFRRYIELLNAEYDLARKRVRKYLQNAGDTHPAHAAISAYLKVLNSFGRHIDDDLKMCRALAIFATDLYAIARMILKPENNAVLVFYGGEAHTYDLEKMLLTIRWSINHQKQPPAETPEAFWGPAFVEAHFSRYRRPLHVFHNLVAEELRGTLQHKTKRPRRGEPDARELLLGT